MVKKLRRLYSQESASKRQSCRSVNQTPIVRRKNINTKLKTAARTKTKIKMIAKKTTTTEMEKKMKMTMKKKKKKKKKAMGSRQSVANMHLIILEPTKSKIAPSAKALYGNLHRQQNQDGPRFDFNPLAFPYTHENGSAYTTNCKVDYTAQGSDESIRTAWTCENCTRFPTTQCRLHYTA
jgi:hypothetical protein